MKHYLRNSATIGFSFILISLCLSAIISGCLPGQAEFEVRIENQSNQTLTIDIGQGVYEKGTFDRISWYHNQRGIVKSGEQMVAHGAEDSGSIAIRGTNLQGEIVFSELYTFLPEDAYHLVEIDDLVYQAVIPPLE